MIAHPPAGAAKVRSERRESALLPAPSARGLTTSSAIHVAALLLLLLIPARALSRSMPPEEVDVVFHRLRTEVPAPVVPVSAPKEPAKGPGGEVAKLPPRPAAVPRPPAPSDQIVPEMPAPLPEPENLAVAEAPPEKKPGKAGILAFKDQFASLTKEKAAPRLGAEARLAEADDAIQGSSSNMLTTNTPGSSGGINTASLSRSLGGGGRGLLGGVGGGGGGGRGGGSGGGGGGGIQRIGSPIAPGGDRPLSNGGPGASRTDEEIQIVFDRYKASFYRLYNRELRKDPTLQGQMVLRLTIEPDGSVSMCTLQSSDMKAPDLAAEVVNRVKTINFGAKEGVQALTIVYPIDFLPATSS